MITNEDILTLYTYLSGQTLVEGSAIEKLYTKIGYIKAIMDNEANIRNMG